MRLEDADPAEVALAWPRESQNPWVDEFIGIVRGRTAHSSRNPEVAAAEAAEAREKEAARSAREERRRGRQGRREAVARVRERAPAKPRTGARRSASKGASRRRQGCGTQRTALALSWSDPTGG